MESLLHMGGYVVSVLAAAAIVAAIEALNERCPAGAGRGVEPVALPTVPGRRSGDVGLRQRRS